MNSALIADREHGSAPRNATTRNLASLQLAIVCVPGEAMAAAGDSPLCRQVASLQARQSDKARREAGEARLAPDSRRAWALLFLARRMACRCLIVYRPSDRIALQTHDVRFAFAPNCRALGAPSPSARFLCQQSRVATRRRSCWPEQRLACPGPPCLAAVANR